jgi:alkylated DNA repair dioxygenase AlkB
MFTAMNLFVNDINTNHNYLPKDGIVNYYGKVISKPAADEFYAKLLENVQWENDQAIIFGKLIITARKVAWYGDQEFNYTYSKITKKALLWTPEILALKHIAEQESGEQFNSCLLNLYHNGNEGMAWHSDGETALKKDGAIASMSFGAERKFSFKHKQSKETVSLNLEHGSLLIMKGQTQSHWLHRLPPTTKIQTPRINLTFRFIVE